MFKKFYSLGLVSTIALSLFPLPSHADVRIVQSSNQTISVSGSNNQVYQVINQTIIYRSGRRQNEQEWKQEKRDNRRELRRNNGERGVRNR